jgi:hypothetical protein
MKRMRALTRRCCYDQCHVGLFLGSEVSSHHTNAKPDLIASFFLALILIGVPVNILSNRLYENSWTVGEWLITYAGGFVRRGLPGSVIYNLADSIGLSPTYLIWAACLLLYLALAWLVVSFCKGKFEPSLLVSPLILLGPVLGNNLVRKDIFMLVAYGLCLHIIRNRRRRGPGGKMATAALINMLSMVAILSHETYGFWALPSLAYVLSGQNQKPTITCGDCLRSLALLLPSIVVFCTCLLFRGSPMQARQIHESWQQLVPTIRSLGTLWDTNPPDGAIQAIGWSTSKALSLPLSSLHEVSSGLWIPAVWMLTIYLCINLFVGRGDPLTKAAKRMTALYQFLAILPLFIIGYDFGRWIFIWITSSALLYGFLTAEPAGEPKPSQGAKGSRLACRLIPGVDRRGCLNVSLIVLAIPRCCWTVAQYWHCTPIGYLSVLIKDLKILSTLGLARVLTP